MHGDPKQPPPVERIDSPPAGSLRYAYFFGKPCKRFRSVILQGLQEDGGGSFPTYGQKRKRRLKRVAGIRRRADELALRDRDDV